MKRILKVIVFLAMILIGILPLFFAGIMATKTKLQAISFIKQLPENSIMYLGIAIAFCCIFVMTYGLLRLIGMKEKKSFSIDKIKEKSCIACRFNDDMDCTVGTHYAARGMSVICYEGERWEKK